MGQGEGELGSAGCGWDCQKRENITSQPYKTSLPSELHFVSRPCPSLVSSCAAFGLYVVLRTTPKMLKNAQLAHTGELGPTVRKATTALNMTRIDHSRSPPRSSYFLEQNGLTAR